MRTNIKMFAYICEDCSNIDYFVNDSLARSLGWSVSSSRYRTENVYLNEKFKRCWCPRCAGPHRRGKGATGRPLSNSK